MSNTDVETRLAIAERDIKELRDMRTMIHAMDKKLDMLASRNVCPDPGACLRMEPRLRSLEDSRAKLTGALALAGGIGSLVGGIIVTVAGKLF